MLKLNPQKLIIEPYELKLNLENLKIEQYGIEILGIFLAGSTHSYLGRSVVRNQVDATGVFNSLSVTKRSCIRVLYNIVRELTGRRRRRRCSGGWGGGLRSQRGPLGILCTWWFPWDDQWWRAHHLHQWTLYLLCVAILVCLLFSPLLLDHSNNLQHFKFIC